LSFVIQNSIYTAVICITRIDSYCSQAAATTKRTVTNIGDAGRNGDRTGFALWALNQGGLSFVIQNSIYTSVICITRFNSYCSQTAAARKCEISNAGDAGRDGDAGQAVATRKRTVTNTGDAGRNGDADQAAAIRKRIIPNASDTIANGHTGQSSAIRKRTEPDAGDGVRNGDRTGFACRT